MTASHDYLNLSLKIGLIGTPYVWKTIAVFWNHPEGIVGEIVISLALDTTHEMTMLPTGKEHMQNGENTSREGVKLLLPTECLTRGRKNLSMGVKEAKKHWAKKIL